MFEKELQTYLKAASSALPCAEARAAFEGYVHCVAQDVCSATSEESFTVVVAQLGSTPEQAARDFMESQSPETIARWKAAAHRHKFRLRLSLDRKSTRLNSNHLDIPYAVFCLKKESQGRSV